MNTCRTVVVGIGVAAALGLMWAGDWAQAIGTQEIADSRIEAVRLNTLGVAYMTQQRAEAALELFVQAVGADPALETARLNWAIALFNLQRFDDALAILEPFTAEYPERARAWYNLGLTYRNLGMAAHAVTPFERVVDLDPADPDAHYLVGLIRSQLGQYSDAIAAFDNALALAPYHASAEFGMTRVHLLQGQREQTEEHQVRYTRIVADNLGVPMGQVYGDQGPYSLAEHASDLAPRPSEAEARVSWITMPAAGWTCFSPAARRPEAGCTGISGTAASTTPPRPRASVCRLPRSEAPPATTIMTALPILPSARRRAWPCSGTAAAEPSRTQRCLPASAQLRGTFPSASPLSTSITTGTWTSTWSAPRISPYRAAWHPSSFPARGPRRETCCGATTATERSPTGPPRPAWADRVGPSRPSGRT